MTGCLKINKPQEDNYKLEPLAESRKIIRSRKMSEVPRGWLRRPCSSWGLGTWRGCSGGSMSQAATGDSQGVKGGDPVGWLGATHGDLRKAGCSRLKLCSEAEEAAGLREDGLAEKRGEEAGEVGGAEVRAGWRRLGAPSPAPAGQAWGNKMPCHLVVSWCQKERKGGKDGGSSLMAAGRVLQKSGKFMVVLVIACKSSHLTKL